MELKYIKHIKYTLVASISILLIGYGCWCLAENFLTSSNSRNKRNTSSLKQDIAEVLANILSLSIKDIQVKAQIQQELFNNIKDLAENNKQNFIIKSNSYDQLKAGYDQLNMLNQKLSESLSNSYKLLSYLKDKKLDLVTISNKSCS